MQLGAGLRRREQEEVPEDLAEVVVVAPRRVALGFPLALGLALERGVHFLHRPTIGHMDRWPRPPQERDRQLVWPAVTADQVGVA